MSDSGYFTRLAAVLLVAALLGAVIMQPDAGKRYARKAAALQPEPTPMAARACARGEAALGGPFALIDDVLSISPLGGVTAPGEQLPAPYIRINTRKGETVFDRRQTTALAPVRADITAIERRIERDDDGRAASQTWKVHFRACETITFYFDRLDTLDKKLLARAGGLQAFAEIGGPDHLALQTLIRVRQGDAIGAADGFDVGLQDLAANPATFVNPDRYHSNPYARAAVFDTDPALLAAIDSDDSRARCAIEYLPAKLANRWSEKLGDAWGMRRAKGDDACRTALINQPETALGAWFTDASHNAATMKVSAIALSPDTIDPNRLIFALHGRLRSLTPEMVALAPMLDRERAEAARDFLSFERGEGRINAGFDDIQDGKTYCYQNLRANFVGPRINGVILLQTERTDDGAALMKIEARDDVLACVDIAEPWNFSSAETTFYR